ncbi:uncharacterized protein CLUP02_10032 [Colletotrichum lupini]|uniref:Uncharacterized protein n=1 Tax=Colletotrichum lupini TaxID=145971 RepID=A0A9Q8SWS0_9PEZI|nr:uncharacterized protein CLUP02_10032 [Colletotrichum lupini]UQC84535.1 hypothetical protein CLUP02_10032 [Colletotrichum lupini]
MNYILARSCPCLLHACTPANDPIVGTYIPIPYQTCLPYLPQACSSLEVHASPASPGRHPMSLLPPSSEKDTFPHRVDPALVCHFLRYASERGCTSLSFPQQNLYCANAAWRWGTSCGKSTSRV